jgi:hypothetical protein
MLKKLELQSLRADIGTVSALLQDRPLESDPIGHMQLSQRKAALEAQLAQVEEQIQHKAAVALFFNGGPVIGSRGIDASFAGKTVGLFQELVSKQFAAEEIGDIGRRGPVPMRTNSDLLLTNVVRGSVGVLLEETEQNEVIADTQLKIVVDHVIETISAAAAPLSDDFERALEGMDSRYLSALGQFFEVMDEHRALLRLVEDERELELDAEAIRRGRDRAGAARIDEREFDNYIGRIYILPVARRFELWLAEGEPILGGVANDFARHDLDRLLSAGDVIGERWRVRLKVRTVSRPNRAPKVTYTLMGMIERVL